MKSRHEPLRPRAAVAAALTRTGSVLQAPAGQPAVLVDDHLEPRVRIPADLLRCVIAVTEVGVLVGLALLANATAAGVDVDVVGASQRLPAGLLRLVGDAGALALAILPAAIAIRLCLLKQFRR